MRTTIKLEFKLVVDIPEDMVTEEEGIIENELVNELNYNLDFFDSPYEQNVTVVATELSDYSYDREEV